MKNDRNDKRKEKRINSNSFHLMNLTLMILKNFLDSILILIVSNNVYNV